MMDKITHDLYRREGLTLVRNSNPGQSYRSLIRKKADMLSLEDLATLRILNGAESEVCKNGTFVREGLLYLPNANYLVRDSSETIISHESKNFLITEEEIELYFDSYMRIDTSSIALENSSNNPLLRFMFGTITEEYISFLLKNSINNLGLRFAEKISKPSLLPIYVETLRKNSIIDASKNKSEIGDYVFGYKF
jgi:hypothetical protein